MLLRSASLLVLFFASSVFGQSNHFVTAPADFRSEIGSAGHSIAQNEPHEVIDPVQYPSLNFGVIVSGASVEKTMYFKGALFGQRIGINVPKGAKFAGSEYTAWVSDKDEVTIRCTNTTSEDQKTGGEQTFRIRIK